MEITAILALVNAALLLIEKLPAALSSLKQSAELTPEQAAELDRKIDEFAAKAARQLGQ